MALDADGMSSSDVSLRDTHVEGEVRLLGANLGGHLSCSKGTKLINPGGYALNAEGCQLAYKWTRPQFNRIACSRERGCDSRKKATLPGKILTEMDLECAAALPSWNYYRLRKIREIFTFVD